MGRKLLAVLAILAISVTFGMQAMAVTVLR
jgi:hypothetical protein